MSRVWSRERNRLNGKGSTQGIYDVFEIAGPEHFVLIRRGIDKKIFFVTLSRTKINLKDIGETRDEIGVENIAMDNGCDLPRRRKKKSELTKVTVAT
jgi:hypothetical protein